MGKRVKIAGRAKGTPNKVTAAVRQMLSGYIEHEMNWINDNLHSFDTNQRLTLFTKILPLILPKEPTDETMATGVNPPIIIFTKDESKKIESC